MIYHTLHRHPDTKPEEWYAFTDPKIEKELLEDYSNWIYDTRLLAHSSQVNQRLEFYRGLAEELEIDRLDAVDEFRDVEERMFCSKQERMKTLPREGRRVQYQFDEEKKAWHLYDSSDEDWDEQEWEIFGSK